MNRDILPGKLLFFTGNNARPAYFFGTCLDRVGCGQTNAFVLAMSFFAFLLIFKTEKAFRAGSMNIHPFFA